MNKKVYNLVIEHPDQEEVLVKLISEISVNDIHSWLSAKYSGNKQLVITKKNLQIFKDEYLDFYETIKNDMLKKQFNSIITNENDDDNLEKVKSNKIYQKKLEEYLDKEIDIKTVIAKLVAKVETRIETLYDTILDDPRNIKLDKIVIDYFNLLFEICNKYSAIYNGNPENITIQNNINIQLVDNHINLIHSVIKEILTQLDYESSLLFTELFTKKLSELKATEESFLPVEKRLEAAYTVSEQINTKLNN